MYTQETQVSGAVKQTHRQKQHTDTHAQNLMANILKRLEIFWKPDVCCGLMSVYTKTGKAFFFFCTWVGLCMCLRDWSIINSAMVENAIYIPFVVPPTLHQNTQRRTAHNTSSPSQRFCPRNLSVITVFKFFTLSPVHSLFLLFLFPEHPVRLCLESSSGEWYKSDKDQREDQIGRSMGHQSKE